jgi:PAS domain S-box-containing protein
MRDQHRPKEELVAEVIGLRKQVADLKAEGVARRRVEEALRAAEEQYRLLVECAAVGICRVSASGTLLLGNSALAELLGYASRAELVEVGKVLGLFAGHEEERRVLAALPAAGEAGAVEAEWRLKDGTPLPVRLRARPERGGESWVLVVEAVAEVRADGLVRQGDTDLRSTLQQ